MSQRDLQTRFWAKVDMGPVDECWAWRGYCGPRGYGYVSVAGLPTTAHRVAYQLNVGPIPSGLEIDHLCRNKACVNPAHLEPVTHRVNVLRSTGPCAKNARKTHCHRGHPFDAANTYIKSDGRRECVACRPECRSAA